jgi:cytidylate kinase
MAKITIFGLAGTGKTTAGKMLAEKLGYSYMSSGSIFRNYAIERGLSLNQFEAIANTTDEYDRKLDQEVEEYGKMNNNFVFESRLAWHFIPDSFKVNLTCNFEERLKRVAAREDKSFDQVNEETTHREDLITKRYKEYYGIENFSNPSNFDYTVDTTENNPEKVVELIYDELKSRNLI